MKNLKPQTFPDFLRMKARLMPKVPMSWVKRADLIRFGKWFRLAANEIDTLKKENADLHKRIEQDNILREAVRRENTPCR